MTTIHSDVAAAVGNTPLFKLIAASEATGCEIFGKAEFMNPGQSIKDRAALFMIRAAVASGAAAIVVLLLLPHLPLLQLLLLLRVCCCHCCACCCCFCCCC